MTTTFATALNCMDGRVQEPVSELLKKEFSVEVADTITEPGIVKMLGTGSTNVENNNEVSPDWLRKKIDISIHHHHSQGIAIVAHADCAGNPITKEEQLQQLKQAKELVKSWYPQTKVLSIWVEPKNDIWQA